MEKKKLPILFGAAALFEAARYTALANTAFWSRLVPDHVFESVYGTLWQGGINCAGSFISYFLLVPVLMVLKTPGELWGFRLRKQNLKMIWFLLFLAGAVLIGPAAMLSRDVQLFYPLFRYAGHHPSLFLAWQGLQILLYLSTEFFYRGPLLFSLDKVLGKWPAISIMCLPYMMSHFGSTSLEILMSIPAGFFLGWLTLRARSILPGFIVHFCAALSVDISSLILRDQLGFLGINAFMP